MSTRLSSKFSVERAHATQVRLSKRVIRDDMLPETIHYVAGVDIAYVRGASIGAVAVLDFNSLSLIESQITCSKTRFPYIPTLLSFREIPPAYSAIRKLRIKPDVFLVDGQGIAHPNRFGFASHLGVVMDIPTVGVAKSLLCGETGPIEEEGWAPIIDKGETIGAAVVTKLGHKPIYISVGHRISLKRAIRIVKQCAQTHRIPEPIRRAHLIANEQKRGMCGIHLRLPRK